jgi:hypothetical protein
LYKTFISYFWTNSTTIFMTFWIGISSLFLFIHLLIFMFIFTFCKFAPCNIKSCYFSFWISKLGFQPNLNRTVNELIEPFQQKSYCFKFPKVFKSTCLEKILPNSFCLKIWPMRSFLLLLSSVIIVLQTNTMASLGN